MDKNDNNINVGIGNEQQHQQRFGYYISHVLKKPKDRTKKTHKL